VKEARTTEAKVIEVLVGLIGLVGPHVAVNERVQHLHANPDSQLEVVIGAVDLDALTRPELDVPTIDDVIPHHFVFALGVQLLARDSFLGFCFLVGFGRRVVLSHGRRRRRDDDHRRPFRRLGVFDRLLDDVLLFFGELRDHIVGRSIAWLNVFGEGAGRDSERNERNQRVANEACRCHLPACYELNVSAA